MIFVKKQSVDGLENWQTNLNGLTTHTKLERLGGGNIRQTVTNPDGTKVVTNSNNGKVITIQSIGADNSSGITVAYTYDEFNRQAGMTQTESGTTFTTSTRVYSLIPSIDTAIIIEVIFLDGTIKGKHIKLSPLFRYSNNVKLIE